MILVELTSNFDEAPTIYEVTQPHLIRVAVVEAYRADDPIPGSVAEAAKYLCENSPRLWAFYSPEDAADWAADYTGPNETLVKFLVQDFTITKAYEYIETYKPTFEEVV